MSIKTLLPDFNLFRMFREQHTWKTRNKYSRLKNTFLHLKLSVHQTVLVEPLCKNLPTGRDAGKNLLVHLELMLHISSSKPPLCKYILMRISSAKIPCYSKEVKPSLPLLAMVV